MLYLAIDQHSKQLTVNLRDESGTVLLRRQVSTRRNAPEEFLRDVQRRSNSEGGYLAIVEVCGFNDWLLELLPRCGCRQIVLVQPDKRGKKKTDRRDANQLGELLWVNRQRLATGERVQGLRRVRIATAQERADRRLTQMRRDVGCQLTRVINGVHAVLRRHNLQQHCPTKGIQSQKAWRWLKELALAELERLEMDQYLARWQLLAAQCEELERRIRDRAKACEEAVVIGSIPGAGAYTALGLASRVGPVERFARPRSLANYWGLTPRCRNSGESTQRLGSITKEGSAMARFLLGQLVMHVLRKDGGMRQWYQRIKKRRGSKIARVAVMRRLATIIWHMLRKNEGYVSAAHPRRNGGDTRTRKSRRRRSGFVAPDYGFLFSADE
jgi:transposase